MHERISNRLKHMFIAACCEFNIFFLSMFIASFFYYLSRPNLLNDELLSKVNDIITGTRLAGCAFSRKMVVSIGTGVIKANFPLKFNLLEVV